MGALQNKRVAVTRPADQAGELCSLLEKEGAVPLRIPLIKIVPPSDPAPLDEKIARLSSYDWVLFTSVNAVSRFLLRLSVKANPAALKSVKVAAVGAKTADAIRRSGFEVALTPGKASAEILASMLIRTTEVSGKRFLLPRAEEGRDELKALLTGAGGEVDLVAAYRTVADPSAASQIAEILAQGGVEWLTFASGSAVRALFSLEGEARERVLRSKVQIAVIGDATAEVASEVGLSVHALGEDGSAESMIAAMCKKEEEVHHGN